MARYTLGFKNIFENVFSSINEAQNFTLEKFEAKMKDGLLYDKNGNRKTLEEIFKDMGYDFLPLKSNSDKIGILENEISNVHIEDGRLVITTKDGNRIKI